jgi:type I restriction enzyme S subunit
MFERAEAWADAEALPRRQGINAGGLMDDEIAATEENRTYPPSVQAGIPQLGVTPAGWHRIRLSEVLEIVSRPANIADDKRYQLVTAKRSRGGIVPREILFGHQIKTKTQFFVEPGDFLISRRQIAHGACGIVPQDLHGAIVSNEYSTFRTKRDLDPRFLQHLTHSVYFQQTCFHSSIGVHVEKLVFKLEDWLEWQFDLPRVEEQRAIANALDAWDRAIEMNVALLAAKRQLAFQLRDSLILGSLRLPGYVHTMWEQKPIGEVGRVVSGATPSTTVPRYWDGDIPWCTPTDITALSGRYIAATERTSRKRGWPPALRSFYRLNRSYFAAGPVLGSAP